MCINYELKNKTVSFACLVVLSNCPQEKEVIMSFEIRHYLSDTYMGRMDISSFEQLYVEFGNYEITINFDEQIIWVKDEFVYEVKETGKKIKRDRMHLV